MRSTRLTIWLLLIWIRLSTLTILLSMLELSDLKFLLTNKAFSLMLLDLVCMMLVRFSVSVRDMQKCLLLSSDSAECPELEWLLQTCRLRLVRAWVLNLRFLIVNRHSFLETVLKWLPVVSIMLLKWCTSIKEDSPIWRTILRCRVAVRLVTWTIGLALVCIRIVRLISVRSRLWWGLVCLSWLRSVSVRVVVPCVRVAVVVYALLTVLRLIVRLRLMLVRLCSACLILARVLL